MGSWGADILESDEASDTWSTLIDDLIDEVRGPLEAEIFIEDLEGTFAVVHALALLGTHGGGLTLPRRDAERWRDRVLAAYDAQIDGLEPTDRYRRDRRAVLVDLFARLAAACEDDAGSAS